MILPKEFHLWIIRGVKFLGQSVENKTDTLSQGIGLLINYML